VVTGNLPVAWAGASQTTMPKRYGQLNEHGIGSPKGALQTVPRETTDERIS
jgi:hypothetical protein